MSEFHVEVVRLGRIDPHPNADRLGITHVRGDGSPGSGYPVCVGLSELKEGDLAIYLPIDSICPPEERWAFLGGHQRIRAKRLRSVFSMGLLTPLRCDCGAPAPADPEFPVTEHELDCELVLQPGADVQVRLRVEKWEPPEPGMPGAPRGPSASAEPGPDPLVPRYTDLEAVRRAGSVLVEGEEVVATEKVHGANARYAFADGRLWAGSHREFKRRDDASPWWRPVEQYGLEAKLASIEGIALYGELYGQVQDLRYGAGPGQVRLAFFDAYDHSVGKRYLDHDELRALLDRLDLPMVPELYRGPWSPAVRAMAEGPSTFVGADHVREGIVVRPVRERWDHRCGRVVLKLVGEGFLLRKGG